MYQDAMTDFTVMKGNVVHFISFLLFLDPFVVVFREFFWVQETPPKLPAMG